MLDLGCLPEVTAALAAGAEENDRTGSFPSAGIEAVHAAGLLTATIAECHGGPGAGLAQTVAILHALGRGDPSVALITAMTLLQHAAQAQQETWPAALYAEVVAESVSRPVLINAGAVGLRWMVVWASTDEPTPRVGSFLVRSDAPGITIEPTWDHLGLRASRSDDVIFADTPVPADAVTGLTEPAAAPRADPALMAWNGLGITALYLGVASAARDWLTGFLTERTPTALGRPLATLPRFISAVGEIEASLTAAVDLVNGLAARADAGDPLAASHAGIAKLAGTRAAIGAVEQAVALVGNNGLTRRYPLERHYRDVLCSRVHTPQDDSVVTAAGQSALALASQGPTDPGPHQ